MASHLGLLAARAIVGAGIFSHGAQKGLGWFEGPGPDGAGQFMASLGFDPGESYARAAYTNEMIAGGLILAGALGPVGPALLTSTMIVAARTVHWKNGFFQQKNGYELSALYTAAALALASGGYGAISFDRLVGLDRFFQKPGRTLWVLALGVAGAMVVLAQRDEQSNDDSASPEAPPAPQNQNGHPVGSGDDVGAGV